MNRRAVLAVAALLVAVVLPSSLLAQEFLIEYSEGFLEVRTRNDWVPVYPGDRLDRDSTLRLDSGAYAELTDGTTTLRIGEAGTYRIAHLVEGRNAPAGRTVASMIRGRLDLLTGPGERGQSTAGGVRGSQEPGDVGLEWVDGESSQELIALGREALSAGDLDQARILFDDALLLSLSEERPEAAFYLGYTYHLLGDMRRALEHLRMLPPDPESRYYHEHVVLLAQTELELSLAEDAVLLLDGYVSQPGRDEAILPLAYLLMGLGHRMCGDDAAARERFEHVRRIAPGSASATTASELLAEG
jgi:tetratricopeptide (TPR) repeat protein